MRKAALLLLLGVAACAHGNRRLDTLPYVPNRVDGSYQGTLRLVSATATIPGPWWTRPNVDTNLCPRSTYGIVEVGDHTLYFDFAPNLIFNVPVKADGSLRQTVGDATISGYADHNRLAFDIVTPVCTSRFVGWYKLNHS